MVDVGVEEVVEEVLVEMDNPLLKIFQRINQMSLYMSLGTALLMSIQTSCKAEEPLLSPWVFKQQVLIFSVRMGDTCP